ncbi:MAG TPA: hypothetical protein VKX17_27950 [Planctomycetota bacterium]|nr:hypothetical protein [Planctomycetota bacterium]
MLRVRYHLSTALVMMLAAATLLYVNMCAKRTASTDGSFGCSIACGPKGCKRTTFLPCHLRFDHGWPCVFHTREVPIDSRDPKSVPFWSSQQPLHDFPSSAAEQILAVSNGWTNALPTCAIASFDDLTNDDDDDSILKSSWNSRGPEHCWNTLKLLLNAATAAAMVGALALIAECVPLIARFIKSAYCAVSRA